MAAWGAGSRDAARRGDSLRGGEDARLGGLWAATRGDRPKETGADAALRHALVGSAGALGRAASLRRGGGGGAPRGGRAADGVGAAAGYVVRARVGLVRPSGGLLSLTLLQRAEGGFRGGGLGGRDVEEAGGQVLVVDGVGGVGEDEVRVAVPFVAAVDGVHLAGPPPLGEEAADDERALVRHRVELPRHAEVVPERREEHPEPNQDEGNHEKRQGERVLCRTCFFHVSEEADVDEEGDEGRPRDAEDHGADGGFGEGAGLGLAGPDEAFVEIQPVLDFLRFFGAEHGRFLSVR